MYTCVEDLRKKYKPRYLNKDLIMDKPIKQYTQDLIIDTVTAVTHLDSTIRIALSNKKISQIKNQTQQTFYTKACLI